MENPVKIIRYSEGIVFESGKVTNMQCKIGTMEEVSEFARKVAEEHGVEVVCIV